MCELIMCALSRLSWLLESDKVWLTYVSLTYKRIEIQYDRDIVTLAFVKNEVSIRSNSFVVRIRIGTGNVWFASLLVQVDYWWTKRILLQFKHNIRIGCTNTIPGKSFWSSCRCQCIISSFGRFRGERKQYSWCSLLPHCISTRRYYYNVQQSTWGIILYY